MWGFRLDLRLKISTLESCIISLFKPLERFTHQVFLSSSLPSILVFTEEIEEGSTIDYRSITITKFSSSPIFSSFLRYDNVLELVKSITLSYFMNTKSKITYYEVPHTSLFSHTTFTDAANS